MMQPCSGRAHRAMWRDLVTVVEDLPAMRYGRKRISRLFGLNATEVGSILSSKFQLRKHRMVDPTEHEIAAIQAASQPAGEYLESIGKTDLANLDEGEWLTLLEVICTAFCDKMAELNSG